jgi:DNA processing protein
LLAKRANPQAALPHRRGGCEPRGGPTSQIGSATDALANDEAGETSATLTQARAALHQGRALFILDNCFRNGLTWPQKFAEKGAIRVVDFDDISEHLSATTH